jgi:hypothetical protein
MTPRISRCYEVTGADENMKAFNREIAAAGIECDVEIVMGPPWTVDPTQTPDIIPVREGTGL